MEYLDGLGALIIAIGYSQWRIRRALTEVRDLSKEAHQIISDAQSLHDDVQRVLPEARALHDSAEQASKSLYERMSQRLSHHIQGKVHD